MFLKPCGLSYSLDMMIDLLFIIIISAKGRRLCFQVCLFVRLSVCRLDYSKSCERILMQILEEQGGATRITIGIHKFLKDTYNRLC